MLPIQALGREVDRPAGMTKEEQETLSDLIIQYCPVKVLEIGMANASSSIQICKSLSQIKSAQLISIDPFQNSQWGGKGVAVIKEAGFSGMHSLVEELDYIALPKLLSEGKKFDFIFIDGWHAFDYALIDIFFSDLLLNVGGLMVMHDTWNLSVWKACRYLESNRPYKNIGPPLDVEASLGLRITRRVFRIFKGAQALRQAKLRRSRWHSLSAYQKLKDYVSTEYAYNQF